MTRFDNSYGDWRGVPQYYYESDYAYAENLGKSAAKKCLKRYSDSSMLQLIKKGKATGAYDKRIEYLSHELLYDEFKHTKEYREAVDKFTEHIKRTIMKVFGKRRLQKYFGMLSDEKLIKMAVDAVMTGIDKDDVFPYENIDWGFTSVIEERIRDISKKMKAKKAAVKKAKQVKRKVRK